LEFVSFSVGSKFVLGDCIFLCWLPWEHHWSRYRIVCL